MSKIDTSAWKEFKVSDLFDIKGSITTPKNDLDLDNSDVYPYITTAATNNGIAGYSSKFTEQGNVLTIDSAVVGTCFYQKQNFTASDHVEKLIPRFKMNENIALFFSCILNKTATTYDYAYNQKRSQKALKAETIRLPVTDIGTPDWQYMENYMKDIRARVGNKISGLESAKKARKTKLDISRWKGFKIGDLFNIKKPAVYHTRQINEKNDGIPYVVRSKFNNGIKYKAEIKLAEKCKSINPAKVVSFGSENASFFYQTEKWISGRDIYYLDTKNLSENICLFLISCFEQITDKYNYKNGMFPALLKKEIIKLPVDLNNEPDWQFMENYMCSIKEKRIKSFIRFINQ